MPVRVLVTGGAGYLGSKIVPRLLDDGVHVTVLDDFRASETSLLPCVGRPGFAVVRGDARDERTLREALEGADVIIPLAAIVGAPACDRSPHDAVTINRDAVHMLVKSRSASQRILFPTTNSGYGKTDGQTPCTESSPLAPVSLYGTSKVEAEATVLDGGNSATFRLATVFGVSPRMRLDLLVNDFTWRAYRDRTVVLFEADYMRNFVSVDDIAELFAWAVRNDALADGAYNVGLSDGNLSKRGLCELIHREVPAFTWSEAAHGTDPDQRNYVVSNDKIESAGFRARTPVIEGVRSLLTAFRMITPQRYGNF